MDLNITCPLFNITLIPHFINVYTCPRTVPRFKTWPIPSFNSCVVPWLGSPASATNRCGSGRGSPVSRCSPGGRPAWTPRSGSAGVSESAHGSHSPSAPLGAGRTPGNVRLERERERMRVRDVFLVSTHSLIPQLRRSHHIIHYQSSLSGLGGWAGILMQSRCWFSCCHSCWLSILAKCVDFFFNPDLHIFMTLKTVFSVG